MRNFKLFVLSVCALVFVNSCDNDDDASNSECDFNIIADENLYAEPSPSDYNISNAEINEDCLEITIQASGCSGSTWEVDLISNITPSIGFTRTIYLSLKLTNLEACAVFITKTYSFDISHLRNEFITTFISIEGWDDTIEVID
ncbi:hypothetical protein FBALC1_03937 [Flavobacteriales bacterium ALC-1]|nr:hypothetical protein FBALC1_03937 [Flavobacteriales bacterium ALC-1]